MKDDKLLYALLVSVLLLVIVVIGSLADRHGG